MPHGQSKKAARPIERPGFIQSFSFETRVLACQLKHAIGVLTMPNCIDLNPGDPFGVFGRSAETEPGRKAEETEAVEPVWLDTEFGGYWFLLGAGDHAAFISASRAQFDTDPAGCEWDEHLGIIELKGGGAPPVEPPPDSDPPNSPSTPDSASAPGEAAPATGPPQAILDRALAWAARGFRIFPIQPGAKVPPKGMLWRNEATDDPAKIRAWWAFNPNYNYGVAGGDGWLIVDVDAGKNGFASLLDVDLPETLSVRTPGGGLHLYLRGPDVANSVDRVAPGIDIRSKGGYVIGPGSVFDDADGAKGYRGAYTLIDDRPAADAPAGFCCNAASRSSATAPQPSAWTIPTISCSRSTTSRRTRRRRSRGGAAT